MYESFHKRLDHRYYHRFVVILAPKLAESHKSVGTWPSLDWRDSDQNLLRGTVVIA